MSALTLNQMQLVKKEDGSFIPVYPADEELANKVPVGEEVTAKRSRNPGFHRKAFALLKLGFDSQEKYDNFEIYRQIITMKAGFVNWIKGTDDKEYPLPKSLSFENMAQDEFEAFYEAVLTVISSEINTDKSNIESELSHFM